MKRITVEIREGKMFIVVPLETPKLSKSGKSKIVATSHGMQVTKATHDGAPVIVSFNAFVNADDEEVEEEEVEEEVGAARVKEAKKAKKAHR